MKPKKGSLREMIALDKARMLPLNFRMNYLFKPMYVFLALVLLVVTGNLLNQDQIAAGAVCLALLALLTVLLLLMIPFVRKKAVQAEMKRYQIKRIRKDSSLPDTADEWDFSDKELSVKFNRYGMVAGGRLYYYNHLKKAVLTDNSYRRVNIMLVFVDGEEQCTVLPLSAKALRMLEDYQVKLDNQETLDYILDHPEEAFTRIYRTGEVS